MKFIHKTVSLCDTCYRHIPGNVVEKDGQIQLIKRCPEHGEMTGIVEIDPEFYYGLTKTRMPLLEWIMEPLMLEVTDKCQLNCPHCYHLPDNKTQDRSRESLRKLFADAPRTCYPMFAGAEPTLRKDFIDLCKELSESDFDRYMVLTNGVKFADEDFVKAMAEVGPPNLCIGLNHPSYQGTKVHNKQLKGIDNLIKHDVVINYIGYTLQSLDELPFILEEVKELYDKLTYKDICHFRIRCGSFIGRSNDKQRSYLSTLVKEFMSLVGDDAQIVKNIGDDNPYHIIVKWGRIMFRLIQWPDVTNIDMEELNTGPWCQFYDGPMTNFAHQVITRDAYINEGKPAYDLCPPRYRYQTVDEKPYWKTDWKGPVEVEELDWEYIDDTYKPVKLPKIIPIDVASTIKL